MNPLILVAVLALGSLSPTNGSQDAFEPGVRVGATLLAKKLLIRCETIGEVTDIALGKVDGQAQVGLILAGTRGYAVLDPTSASVSRTVAFESTSPPELSKAATTCRIADVDGDGDLEFVRLAAHWVGRTSVHGADGKTIWAHPEPQAKPFGGLSIEATGCDDIDGDGKLDFLLTFNATSEVHILDHTGKLMLAEKWGEKKVMGDQVLFLDVDGDGRKEILYVDGEALWTRNAEGKQLAKTRLPDDGYVNHLELVRSFGEPAKDWLFVGHYVKKEDQGEQQYHLVSTDGKTVGPRVTLEAVEFHREAKPIPFGASDLSWVRTDTLKKQAEVAGFSATRLRLRVFDRARSLKYEEVLKASDSEKVITEGSVFFLPEVTDRPAQLVLGYGSEVWSYTIPR